MKLFLSIILKAVSISMGVWVFYYTIRAYFMVSYSEGVARDGWGRLLYDPPAWIKLVWDGMQWPGIRPVLWDVAFFWVVAAIAYGLLKLSFALRGE